QPGAVIERISSDASDGQTLYGGRNGDGPATFRGPAQGDCLRICGVTELCLRRYRCGQRQQNHEQEKYLAGIFHLDSCPRPRWAFFLMLFLRRRFASRFSSSPIVFFWHAGEGGSVPTPT